MDPKNDIAYRGGAGYNENFLHEPLVRPAQSLEGRPIVTSNSIIHGPMTARYVISQEDQELGQVLYLYLEAFYSNHRICLHLELDVPLPGTCKGVDASPTRFIFVLLKC